MEAWGQSVDPATLDTGNADLWPEHREAFEVFADCGSQWRVVAGIGAVFHQGIDYTSLESVMRIRGIEDQAECLRQIRVIERGALDVLNAS